MTHLCYFGIKIKYFFLRNFNNFNVVKYYLCLCIPFKFKYFEVFEVKHVLLP